MLTPECYHVQNDTVNVLLYTRYNVYDVHHLHVACYSIYAGILKLYLIPFKTFVSIQF